MSLTLAIAEITVDISPFTCHEDQLYTTRVYVHIVSQSPALEVLIRVNGTYNAGNGNYCQRGIPGQDRVTDNYGAGWGRRYNS